MKGAVNHLVTKRDKELPPALAPQLVTPGRDLPGQGERAGVRPGEVHPLQLHHHLPHHVVPAVPVEGEHHKVQGEDLVEGKMLLQIHFKDYSRLVNCVSVVTLQLVSQILPLPLLRWVNFELIFTTFLSQ